MPTINFIDEFKKSVKRPESKGEMYEKDGITPLKNKMGSSAKGLYQIIDSTWNNLERKAGRKLNRASIDDNELAMTILTEENARVLQKNNIPINNSTLYAMHFSGNVNFIKKAIETPTLPTTSMFSSDAISKNKPYLQGKTLGEAFNKMTNAVGGYTKENYRIPYGTENYSTKIEESEDTEEKPKKEESTWMFNSSFKDEKITEEDNTEEYTFEEEQQPEDTNEEEPIDDEFQMYI